MITIKNNMFHLATENTSYIFLINELGLAEHLYYGKRLRNPEYDIQALREKHVRPRVNETSLTPDDVTVQPGNLMSEFSTEDKGDYRTPSIAVSTGKKKVRTLDLRFSRYTHFTGIERFSSSLLQALGSDQNTCGVALEFTDTVAGVKATLYYTLFDDSDTITRRVVIENTSSEPLTLRSAYSLQLDLPDHDYELITFTGAQLRERKETRQCLTYGKYINESRRGASSAEANPGIILKSRRDEQCYMTNLIYSGSHREVVEVNQFGKTHVLTGINDDTFEAEIDSGCAFETPEAIMLYSHLGPDDLADKAHRFIRDHIQRGPWKDRLRPIAFNTWEAVHFGFEERKLTGLIKQAAELGFEAFVLDDGWFGARNDDTSSLGDWQVNTLKIPGGLATVARECHRRGMMFGLWFEPEMVSLSSYLYRKHPDWMLGDPARKTHAVCRNQYFLDITRDDVQEYLISTMKHLIQNANVDYIKWDMNRHLSDIWSANPGIMSMGEYQHRYILALYRIQKSIAVAFPNLFLENCASGGARFDLGMLCYGSAIWTSDSSDPIERIPIMEGTSMLYPLSVCGTSVSTSPNYATFRSTDPETRFDVAIFGVLNYSIDIMKYSDREKAAVKDQVEFYKQYRQVLQFGTFRKEQSGNITVWSAASPDRSTIIVLYVQTLMRSNCEDEILKISQANESFVYRVVRRDDRSPVWDIGDDVRKYGKEEESYEVTGDTLKWAGIRLSEKCSGSGYGEGMRVMPDFSSRVYIIKKI
ncbi:MAG: alpha-galactosidase [Bullifex sp.]